MNGSINSLDSNQKTDHAPAGSCSTESCGTGVCSPCLLIWGGLGIYLLVITLVEVFR